MLRGEETSRIGRIGYLLVAVLHGALQLPLGGGVLFKVDLLEVFDGGSVKVVEFCTERRCKGESGQVENFSAGTSRVAPKRLLFGFTQLGLPLVLQLEAQRLQLLLRLLPQDVQGPPVGLLQGVDLLPLLLLQTLL